MLGSYCFGISKKEVQVQTRLVVLLIFFKSFVCLSQTDSVITLSEVVIKNEVKVDNPIKTSETTHSINNKIIKENASKSVAEASDLLPGVYLQNYGGVGGLKTLSSRGMATGYTRVFIDGVEFKNAQTGQVDLGKIPISNVSKIIFVNGTSGEDLLPASSLNSPQALYIETESVTKNSTGASLSIGSFGLVNPAVFVKRKLGKRQTLSVGGEFIQANGKYDYVLRNGDSTEKRTRTNAGISRSVVNFKYSLAVSDSQSVTLGGYWNMTNQELPGAVILYQPQVGQNLNTNDVFLTASYKNIRSKKWQLKSTSSVTFQGLEYIDTVYHNQAGFLNNKYQNNNFFTSLSSHYQYSKQVSLNSAIDFSHTSLSKSIYVSRNQLFISNQVKFKYKSIDAKVYGLFQALLNQDEAPRNLFNYGVSSSWMPFKKSPIQLLGSYSKNYRIPTFQELYFQRVFVALVPEKAEAIYVGISSFFQLKKRTIQVATKMDYFINHLENKIVSLPTQNLFVWSTQNLGAVAIQGIESSLQFDVQLDSAWSLSGLVSYTFQQALDVTNKESRKYKNQLPYTPFEILKANTSVSYQKWVLNWGMIYNGYRYSLGENIEANFLPSWHVHNLSLGKKITAKKGVFELQFSVKNIFGKQYSIIKSFPMPGRNYLASIAIEI